LLEFLEWFTIRWSDDAIFVSRRTQVDWGMAPGRVVHNGVDTNHYHPDPSDRERARRDLGLGSSFTVAFIGRWSKIKGIDETLRAIAAVHTERGPAIKFLLVGGGTVEEEEEVRSTIRRLGLETVIVVRGRVRESRLPLLRASDVFLLPSYAEGLPIALLEAMAVGLPCVATDAGGVAEVIEDSVHGFIVPRGDAHALEERIRLLMDHPSLREALGREACERVQSHFDLHTMVEAYVQVYGGLEDLRHVSPAVVEDRASSRS
jgi:glycosyltransferase involved in cell wall biosynthesis